MAVAGNGSFYSVQDNTSAAECATTFSKNFSNLFCNYCTLQLKSENGQVQKIYGLQ
jgi:hypothetical protein